MDMFETKDPLYLHFLKLCKIFESQIIKKKIGNKKPKNLNRIDTIV